MTEDERHQQALTLVGMWENDLSEAADGDPCVAFSLLMLTVCGMLAKLHIELGADKATRAEMANACEMMAKTVRAGGA